VVSVDAHPEAKPYLAVVLVGMSESGNGRRGNAQSSSVRESIQKGASLSTSAVGM